MNSISRLLLGTCSLAIALAVSPHSLLAQNSAEFLKQLPPALGTPTKQKEQATLDMRGYGKVSAEGALWPNSVALVRFTSESDEKAAILASKYIKDFAAYGAITELPKAAWTGGVTFSVRHGGIWTVGVNGSNVFVLSGPTEKDLAPFAKALAAQSWKAPQKDIYPRYLDNFDNASLGIWWMPTTKPAEILEFFREKPGVINAHGQNLGPIYAPNVYETTAVENIIAQAHYINKPYRLMLWSGTPSWWGSDNHGSKYAEHASEGGGYRSLFEAGGYANSQVATPAYNALLMDSMIHYMNYYKNDPSLLAWMEPHGEFFQSDPVHLMPDAKERFVAYLKNVKHYSLEDVQKNYGISLKNWDDLSYPETAYFYGRRGEFMDLDEPAWRWNPDLSLEKGIADGVTSPTFDDSSWAKDRRVSPQMLSQFGKSQLVAPLWMRFHADIPASFLKGTEPLYVHVMPYTERDGGKVSLWVNGKEATARSGEDKDHRLKHIEFNVRDLLQAGDNQFTLYSNGGRISYRVFLSKTPNEPFPFKEEGLSRLWVDWYDHYRWEKLQTLEAYLKQMRAIDPNRPFKVMTPHLFQTEAMDLLQKYGAYPQLTGEGAGFYRPMHYKGYARLRDMPGSSEPGGAMENMPRMQGMFANIFWESQDVHDYVFDAQRDFWSKPDVVKWWADNADLLKTLGKTDFAKISVGELRDLEQTSRFQNGAIWTGDMARGPLPNAGFSPVLIDGPEFDRAMADKVPVIFDCATMVVTPERVAAVKRYVENGGIFVAQFNTGRHEPFRRDTWPLAQALGIKVTDYSVEGSKDKGLGKIQFTEEQKLFPTLQGQTTEGRGISITSITPAGADQPKVSPVATWDDGSMAICDITLGKGRFIWLGTPFYLNLKRDGVWLSDADRQLLVNDLLVSLGVTLPVASSNDKVWIEKRASKNGLYDVYMTAAMNIRGRDWKIEDLVETDLTLRGVAQSPVVELSQAALPDVPTTVDGQDAVLKAQVFQPFQVRQFAVIRPDAGLDGPLHWLKKQWGQWRAVTVPTAQEVDVENIQKMLEVEIKAANEDGINLTKDWQVRVFTTPQATEDGWNAPTFDAATWQKGNLGTWLTNGWNDAKVVQYRKSIELPKNWLEAKRRVLIGFQGFHLLGMKGEVKTWINGELIPQRLDNTVLIDVTAQAQSGKLDIAMEVTGDSMGSGPAGSLYLRSVATASATESLDGEWTLLEDWHKTTGSVTLPGNFTKGLGLRRSFEVPAAWAGKKIRLVLEQDGNIDGCIVNGDAYFRVSPDRTEGWFPFGLKIDAWLKPGTNTIDLIAAGHANPANKVKLSTKIKSIRLEMFE